VHSICLFKKKSKHASAQETDLQLYQKSFSQSVRGTVLKKVVPHRLREAIQASNPRRRRASFLRRVPLPSAGLWAVTQQLRKPPGMAQGREWRPQSSMAARAYRLPWELGCAFLPLPPRPPLRLPLHLPLCLPLVAGPSMGSPGGRDLPLHTRPRFAGPGMCAEGSSACRRRSAQREGNQCNQACQGERGSWRRRLCAERGRQGKGRIVVRVRETDPYMRSREDLNHRMNIWTADDE
jgi:hypothetical protein